MLSITSKQVRVCVFVCNRRHLHANIHIKLEYYLTSNLFQELSVFLQEERSTSVCTLSFLLLFIHFLFHARFD